MIYLASPYSHPDPTVMSARHNQVQRFTAHSMQRSHIIFSPIVYGHTLAMEHVLPTDAQYWREFNETIIRACDEMWVLMLEGWRDSKGVAMEVDYATELKMPIRYKAP